MLPCPGNLQIGLRRLYRQILRAPPGQGHAACHRIRLQRLVAYRFTHEVSQNAHFTRQSCRSILVTAPHGNLTRGTLHLAANDTVPCYSNVKVVLHRRLRRVRDHLSFLRLALQEVGHYVLRRLPDHIRYRSLAPYARAKIRTRRQALTREHLRRRVAGILDSSLRYYTVNELLRISNRVRLGTQYRRTLVNILYDHARLLYPKQDFTRNGPFRHLVGHHLTLRRGQQARRVLYFSTLGHGVSIQKGLHCHLFGIVVLLGLYQLH